MIADDVRDLRDGLLEDAATAGRQRDSGNDRTSTAICLGKHLAYQDAAKRVEALLATLDPNTGPRAKEST